MAAITAIDFKRLTRDLSISGGSGGGPRTIVPMTGQNICAAALISARIRNDPPWPERGFHHDRPKRVDRLWNKYRSRAQKPIATF